MTGTTRTHTMGVPPSVDGVSTDGGNQMSHSLFALYNHPEDPKAFDAHYAQTHSALCLGFEGLRSFTGTHPGPGPDGSPPPYYFMAVLTFDDEQALTSALSGAEGQAAVADLGNFAGAGVTLLTGPTVTFS